MRAAHRVVRGCSVRAASLACSASPDESRDVHAIYTRVWPPSGRRLRIACRRGHLRQCSGCSPLWHTACLTARRGGVQMATKILVVDDDERLAAALEQLLNLEGYQASVALSAEAALEKFRTDTYHLVLSDLQ